MPLFKGQGFKAKPNKAIKYVTDSKKAAIIVTHALDDGRDYAAQFKETYSLFEKGLSFGSRKYYHFKHSFDPKDNVSPAEASQMTEELARQVFDDHEYIIATHTDKAHIHCHLIVNSVSFETGRMLHLNNAEYAELKDLSNSIAVSHGYSALDFRKAAADRISSQENRVTLKGGTSWKEELREVITLAVKESTTIDEFEAFINEYGVEITRNTEKTISFKHPQKQKSIRGDKLGANYTKEAIKLELEKHEYRNGSAIEENDGYILRKRRGRYYHRQLRAGAAGMEASTAGTQRQYIGEATASDLRSEFKSDESDDGLLELSETNKNRGR